MSNTKRDVVVVGGGPAGTATALFLRQRGRDVLLLDEARFPRDKICGESVSPEAWRLFDRLGVAGRVAALQPQPVHGMRLTAPDGTSFIGEYPDDRPRGFALQRRALDHELLRAAKDAGVEVCEGTRATDLACSDGIVDGVVWEHGTGGGVTRARLVVGADGRRSRVARRLGLLRYHPRFRKFALRGHWSGMQGLTRHGEMHVSAGGYCGVAPLPDGLANVAFVLDEKEMSGAAGDLSTFYLRSLRRWPRLSQRLEGARLLAGPRAIGPLALEARALSAPGVLLVGDAAGFYDPFTGEGITLALRSAEIAAEVADTALAGRSVAGLSEYDRRRAAVTRDKFRLNRLLQRLIAWPTLADRLAHRLARRRDLADRLVGIAGDFVSARTALNVGFLWDLLRS